MVTYKNSQLAYYYNKTSELMSEFERLKFIFECPRLFICNHFDELRCQVDLTFCAKFNKSSHETTNNQQQAKSQLTENWTDIIKAIDSFEAKCLKHKSLNKFNLVMSHETVQKIKAIERLIKQLSASNQEDQSDQVKYAKNLIYDETFKIEKILFLNQTLVFLDESTCRIKNVFNKSSVGKLLLIRNEYFGQKSIEYLKKYPIFFKYF